MKGGEGSWRTGRGEEGEETQRSVSQVTGGVFDTRETSQGEGKS